MGQTHFGLGPCKVILTYTCYNLSVVFICTAGFPICIQTTIVDFQFSFHIFFFHCYTTPLHLFILAVLL